MKDNTQSFSKILNLILMNYIYMLDDLLYKIVIHKKNILWRVDKYILIALIKVTHYEIVYYNSEIKKDKNI